MTKSSPAKLDNVLLVRSMSSAAVFFFFWGGGALNLPNHVDLTIEDYSNLNWRPLCPAWSNYTGSNTFELYIYITRI